MSRASFSWFKPQTRRCLQPGSESHVVGGISLPHEVGVRRFEWVWLELFKVLLGCPLHPALHQASVPSPCPDPLVLAEQDTQVNLLDLPGVLSSCPCKSEWIGSEVCLLHSLPSHRTLCFWRNLRKAVREFSEWPAVHSDTDMHDMMRPLVWMEV